MSTHLLTWNPSQYDWQRLPYLVYLTAQGWPVVHDWSCPKARGIRDGDRCFLLRRGQEPDGIIGSGKVISPQPYRARPEQKGPAHGDKAALFVDVQFDALLDPETDPLLPRSDLGRGSLAAVDWDKAESGASIPDAAARELETLWQKHLARIRWRERNNLA